VLGLVACLAGPPAAAQQPGASSDVAGPRRQAGLSFADRVARDARLSFTSRSADQARTLLADREAAVEERAAAWIALGCAGAVRERPELEDRVLRGSGLEREAALLALGELSSGADAFFTALLGEPDGLAECALLALLRTQRASARRRVEEIASDEDHALRSTAQALLVFQADPAFAFEGPPPPVLEQWLDLRWLAARRFGLVGGSTWPVLLIQSLASDERFRGDLVLRGTEILYRPGVRDHLLQLLLEGQGAARLRAALHHMPLEVQSLVENELWLPRDAGEWLAVLEAIEERGLESLCSTLVARAGREPGLAPRAAILVARGKQLDLLSFLEPELKNLTLAERIAACDAFAESGDPAWRARLEDLGQSLEPELVLAALVARVRLGSRVAEEELRTVLDDPEHERHAALLAELVRVARDLYIGNLLEDYLPRAQEDEELPIALALCREGRVSARGRVRRALSTHPTPSGPELLRLVRALCRAPGPEDLEVLRALFPLEGQREANLVVAGALLELRDPAVQPILRAALWRSDFDLAVLAGAVLAESGGGPRLLREELRAPPREATSEDLRRVGYAIGAWGGMREVEDLARELRYASSEPALQGALLGALAARTQ